jgi:hypothetical protein
MIAWRDLMKRMTRISHHWSIEVFVENFEKHCRVNSLRTDGHLSVWTREGNIPPPCQIPQKPMQWRYGFVYFVENVHIEPKITQEKCATPCFYLRQNLLIHLFARRPLLLVRPTSAGPVRWQYWPPKDHQIAAAKSPQNHSSSRVTRRRDWFRYSIYLSWWRHAHAQYWINL